MKWQCRYAPSLGALEGTPDAVWGTKPYLDEFQPTVFMGLYGLPDFYTLWRHKGRKAILWCGSDITHFSKGYWLDEDGKIKIEPEALAQWINANCESYVENGVEHEALMVYGIESKIVPSFMGNVKDYELSYEKANRPQVYASVSGNLFRDYGWEQIEIIADRCNVDFHLYGNSVPVMSERPNVFIHGRIEKEDMNEQIKHMQAGLRLNEFDGFSEILAKSALWGHHSISRIGYPMIQNYTTNEELIQALNSLADKEQPNTKARDHYLKTLNAYPWNFYAKD